jgi:hypothetical protein
MNIHLGVFVIPNQQSRVEVNDVNTVRDAGLVVPATRSEATPPPTPAAHDGSAIRIDITALTAVLTLFIPLVTAATVGNYVYSDLNGRNFVALHC